ncbi:MAG: phosphohydrolase, partial [Candidatus Helarchaeota archaeon]
LIKLKNFNYKKIYENPKIKTAVEKNKLKNMFYTIFEYFLNELNKNNKNSEIFKDHINYIGPKYLKNTDYELIVIDFISGMTDSYFIDLYKKITLPEIKRLP